ncbi:hypothetical protein BaRGS_00014684 [Batillaria attramentaria]|uniref:Cep57 centrosome microtubule-binding domain-containing protein n=1 Tax=Batillaria attramentaria TaxID=370345 RepID=A0ABD0L413_9CAEN
MLSVTDRDQPRELERERRPPYSVPQEQTSSTSPSHPRVVPIHQEADQHQPSQHAVRHAEVSGRSAEFDDRDSHDGSYLWMRRQVPGRTERDVIVFTSSVPKDSRSSREPTHTSREPTHDSPGRRRDEAQESYRREAARQRQQVDRNASERSGSNTDASRSGLAGLSMSGSEVSGSVPSPGAIPNFRTLQDQQVSWLAMYRLLEEEHRGELQAQYVEHQRMINDMQRHLDRELLRQHQSVQQKLDKHREALIASSPRQQSSRREAERSTDSRHPRQTGQRDASDDSDVEETHMKPPSRNHYGRADIDSWETGGRASSHVDSAASQRSPDGRSSARSPREEHRSRSEQGREKRLRGGVYSSPMPISRTKAPSRGPGSLNSSVRESGQLDGNMSNNARSSYESGRHQEESMSRSRDLSFHEDDVLSPRTRSSLREKHAKHLADLRAYYEAEIQELRDQLTAAAGGPVLSSSSSMGRETATERILREENQSLRLKCQDLQDALDDANIRTREMEQKLQGLEIRAADYADRYEDSQHTVLKLKNRLEELHAFAKEREAMLEEVEARERRQAAAMEELYKTKEEQAENQRRDKAALKRLLDKYETLEKEYTTLKNTSAEVENKLYEMRNETMDLNKIISRLELENKRLSHDNDNMRHRLAISGRPVLILPCGCAFSLPITRQDVEETTERTRDRSTDRLAHSTGSLTNRQQDRSLDRLSARSPRTEGRLTSRSTMSDDEEADAGKLSDSPLLKAERELRRLQESMGRSDFALKLQPKKYSSVDSLPAYNGYSDVTIIDGLKSSSRSGSTTAAGEAKKSKPKKNLSAFGRTNPPVANGDPRDSVSGKPGVQNKPAEQAQSSSLSSPTRFDVGVRQGVSRSPPSRGAGQVVRERESSRDRAGERTRDKSPVNMSSSAKGTGQSVDATLERIRTGGIVSRPQWEDVYTSLAKPRQADNKSSSLNMTQEELLRERIRSIEQLEHRYDELTMEKRKLESQLNKVPIHGRVDRKSRREKELLEEQLDKVDHELGSLRMTLKRYQVLKTTI